MNKKDKLTEATIRILQEADRSETLSGAPSKEQEKNIMEQFAQKLVNYINKNSKYKVDYKSDITSLYIYPQKDIEINLDIFIDPKRDYKPLAELSGGPIGHFFFYDTSFFEEDFEKLINRIDKLIVRSKNYIEKQKAKSNKSVNMKWEEIDNEPLTYHSEKDKYIFNIYFEDDNYSLTVNYDTKSELGELELQDYDSNFKSLEDAKQEAERIYKLNPGPDYEY